MDYMWKTHFIYAIRHNVTGKVYIGCTATNNRIKTHLSNLKNGKHKNAELQKDCDEYGYKFSVYLLEIVSRSESKNTNPHDREAYWIHYYGADDPEKGYNSPSWYTRVDITTFPLIKNTEEMRVSVK